MYSNPKHALLIVRIAWLFAASIAAAEGGERSRDTVSMVVAIEPVSEMAVAIEPASEVAMATEPVSEMAVAIEPVSEMAVAIEPVSEMAVAIEPVSEVAVATEPASEEIVVTARKREENVQDVPLAVSVLSADALEERAIVDLSEIQAGVPNLSISAARNQTSSRTTFLRGIGQAEPLWGVDPGVGLYLDGVYLARAQGALLDVFEVERIEVLRGPQGTLYGKNTIGGAIRYISRPLTDDFRGSVAATAGSHGTVDWVARAAGAVVPGKVRVGAAFASLRRDGYGRNLFLDRDLSNKDTTAFRLALDWLATEALTVRLRYDRTKDDAEPAGLTRLEVNPLCPSFGVVCEPLARRFDNEAGLEPLNGTVSTGASLSMDWELSPQWRFEAITAWRDADTLNYQDFDGSPARIVEAGSDYQDQQLSHELRLVYQGESRWQGVLGAYFFDGRAGGRIRQWLFGSSNTLITGEVHTDSVALFGEGSYVLGDRLTLHVGARFTEEEKRGVSFNATYLEQTFDTLDGVLSDFDRKATFSSVSPRLGLDFAFSERAMAYASLSRGFKGGGFNVRAQEQVFPESAEPYDDEVLTLVEVGVKSVSAEGSLVLNSAFFHGDYDDVQVGTFTSFDGDGDGEDDSFFGNFTNAGNATIRGVEVEFDWTPRTLGWLRVSGNGSYLDATPDDFVDRNQDGFVDTQVITNAPEWSGALSAHFDFPAWGGLLEGHLGWSYRADSILTSEGGPDPREPSRPLLPLVQPAFHLFQAGLSWTAGDGRWRVSVNGKNLSDEAYLSSGYNVPILGVVSGNYGAPRTMTLTTSRRF